MAQSLAVEISGRVVGPGRPPLVVAELSGNHDGSRDRAFALVEAAARAGADAVKLQTYTADTMTIDRDEGPFRITDPDNPWHGKSLHELYRLAATPWEWHADLFARCRELGMLAFSTPFDATAVEFLAGLGAPCYKIASFELTDLPLIRRVASVGRPMLLATGMATLAEVDAAVQAAREGGAAGVVLLKCTSAYPADPAECHLRALPHMAALFGCPVGLSDHTPGVGVAVAAAALGATVIEKHLTLRRADGGVDAAFSLEPDELALLVREVRRGWLALGDTCLGPVPSERPFRDHRRSLWVVRDLPAGAPLGEESVRAIRPGGGLPPAWFELVRGRAVQRAVGRGTPLTWDLLLPPVESDTATSADVAPGEGNSG